MNRPPHRPPHPPSPRNEAGLRHLRRYSFLLDNSLRLPLLNYRIGLDPLIGLIPGIGDAAGLLLASYLILAAARLGVPRNVLLLMIYNAVLDAAVGTVPLVGDLFAAVWKANARNMVLLERHLDPEAPKASVSRRGLMLFILAGAVLLALVLAALGWGLLWLLGRLR